MPYKVGDIVLVKRSTFDSSKPVGDAADIAKLQSAYCGPFKVASILSNIDLKIELSNKKKQLRTVHVESVKPLQASFAGTDITTATAIVDSRNRVYGLGSRLEYLVRFDLSLGDDANRWIDAKVMQAQLPALVAAFKRISSSSGQ
ncbi:hypothetical protein SAMD00019534_069810 [Acytostelium subglobosum LB1]|uniref:hypothetical protein n=1 Tax=Acytostelium subglobosum LB1 TaxID=1410327 RepID=UPI000644F048|nr:hypothetical protein SAMD00019534_069810 [Acytostelium subglobosum LB1]GAM23806.1 hypothetical protein SAMD00019534_069810 [Acytostelium subglobosum LB1]|eukprot:XP_012753547.1 hypothetical protein SAMD00019534_069810 [Acytostelium subglobosum LB1]